MMECNQSLLHGGQGIKPTNFAMNKDSLTRTAISTRVEYSIICTLKYAKTYIDDLIQGLLPLFQSV